MMAINSMVIQQETTKPTVLVTGGTGFLGRPLVDYLVEQGQRVRVLGRRPVVRWRRNSQIEHIRADIADPGVLERALDGVQAVYHLAAATEGDWQTYQAATVDAAGRLLETFAAQGGGRVIFVSSIYNYDGGAIHDGVEIDENFPLEQNRLGRGYYALAKTEADRVAQRYLNHPLVKLTIVRPGVIYGPNMKNPATGAAISLRSRLWLVLGDGSKPIPFVYLDDVVRGLVHIMACSPAIGRIYNFVGPSSYTQNEYLNTYKKWSNDQRLILKIPLQRMLPILHFADRLMRRVRGQDRQLAYKARRQLQHAFYRGDRLTAETGFAATTTLAEGLRQTWERIRNPS